MDWTQVLTIVVSNLGLILWARGESRADYRHLEQKTLELISGIKSQVDAIQVEMKDFHGRLERIDAEFKGRMEKQDAEFKAHLMHCHDLKK